MPFRLTRPASPKGEPRRARRTSARSTRKLELNILRTAPMLVASDAPVSSSAKLDRVRFPIKSHSPPVPESQSDRIAILRLRGPRGPDKNRRSADSNAAQEGTAHERL